MKNTMTLLNEVINGLQRGTETDFLCSMSEKLHTYYDIHREHIEKRDLKMKNETSEEASDAMAFSLQKELENLAFEKKDFYSPLEEKAYVEELQLWVAVCDSFRRLRTFSVVPDSVSRLMDLICSNYKEKDQYFQRHYYNLVLGEANHFTNQWQGIPEVNLNDSLCFALERLENVIVGKFNEKTGVRSNTRFDVTFPRHLTKYYQEHFFWDLRDAYHKDLGVPREKFESKKEANNDTISLDMNDTISLDMEVYNDGTTLGDIVGDFEYGYQQVENETFVHDLIFNNHKKYKLDRTERFVIDSFYLKELSMKNVAEQLGRKEISVADYRRIQRTAFRKLQKYADDQKICKEDVLFRS